MPITIRQNSFAGGEVSDLLDGRIDLARYMISLKRCRGFWVTKHGALLSRPGTLMRATAFAGRFWVFRFGDEQNFLIDFYDNFFRVIYKGGVVQLPVLESLPTAYPAWSDVAQYQRGDLVQHSSHLWMGMKWSAITIGDPPAWDNIEWRDLGLLSALSQGESPGDLLAATPYGVADLWKLKFSQSHDVVTITCAGHDPLELCRFANDDWGLRVPSFYAPAPVWVDPAVPDIDEMWVEHAPREFSADPKEYDYAVSMLLQDDASGRVYETQADSFTVAGAAIKPSYPGGVGLWDVDVGYSENSMVLGSDGALYQARRYSRGHDPTLAGSAASWAQLVPEVWDSGTTYGLEARAVGSDGYLYRSTISGNVNNNPVGGLPEWAPVRMSFGLLARSTYLPESPITLNWPGLAAPTGATLVAYRLYRGIQHESNEDHSISSTFGLLVEQDTWVTEFVDDGSVPVDYTQSPRTGENPLDGDPPETVGLLDQRRVFGRRNELIMSAVGDYYNLEKPRTVLADSPTRLVVDSTEYEEIRWLVALRALLLGTISHVPYVLSGAGGLGEPFSAGSFSLRSHERFGSAWLDPVVMNRQLIVLEDGSKAVRAVKYSADVDGFQSTDISVLAEHLLRDYGIVDWAYAEKPYNMLWAVRADGVILTVTIFPEQEVLAWAWHDTSGTVENVAAVREDGEDRIYLRVVRNGARVIEQVAVRPQAPDYAEPASLIYLDSALVFEGTAATVFNGLDHLEGLSVMALADGNEVGPFTVVDGAIDISEEVPDGATDVVVGLPYVSEVTLLGAVDKARDISHLRKKVLSARVKVLASRGLEIDAGKGAKEWMQRKVSDSYAAVPAYTGYTQKILVPSDYTESGEMTVRQRHPLPLTILGVEREVDLGDA